MPKRRRLSMVLFASVVCAFSGARADDLKDLLAKATDTLLDNPGHSTHFSLQNAQENAILVNGLNQSIASQLSTVPTGSAAGGFTSTIDPTTGVGSRNSTTFGPQFAERALTIGKRRWDVGIQFLHSSFDQLNGTDITDGSLTLQLLHELEGANRLNPHYQGDVITNQLSYELAIDTALVQGTFGVTDRFDLGLMLPFVSADLTIGNLQTIERLATEFDAIQFHFWDVNGTMTFTRTVSESESASGVGDVVLRGKYNFLDPSKGSGVALALDVRVPTGDENNFLGTGVTQAKIFGVGSWALGKFAPHANLGYLFSSGASEVAGDFPDEIDYTVGFEAECHPRVTFALDFIGRVLLDATVPTMEQMPFLARVGSDTGAITTTTLPQLVALEGDVNLLQGAAGVKINAGGKWLISVAALVPILDNGLTSDLSAVFGFSYSF